MEVTIGSWDLIKELDRRIEKGAVFRAKNGKLWPRFCPACGGIVREYAFKSNFSKEVLAAFDVYTWRRATRQKLDEMALGLPDVPFRHQGPCYFVRCENSFDPISYPTCNVNTFDWYDSLEEARYAFFDEASSML